MSRPSPAGFNSVGSDAAALALYAQQYAANPLYQRFADLVRRDRGMQPATLAEVPFLPISFFKTHDVQTGAWQPEATFESSGTTGMERSRHRVRSLAGYDAAALEGFRAACGDPAQYAILALLPSYLERQASSLVHMARMLMQQSGHPANGFFLDDFARLNQSIRALERAGQRYLLLGVTFALLDYADAFPMALQSGLVMETGGMKGRREELTRGEVHTRLGQAFALPAIHAEYGMTELLSQAYSAGGGRFTPGPQMQVLVRDVNDPLAVAESGAGALNIADLANRDTCAFIATEDLGVVHADGTFEVTGRMDHSALRGCSLLAVQGPGSTM